MEERDGWLRNMLAAIPLGVGTGFLGLFEWEALWWRPHE